MFSGIKRLLGTITVEEADGIVRVEGVDTAIMASHLKQQFSTTKLAKYMFIHMDRSSFSLPSFFLPDFVQALNIMSGYRSLKLPVRTIAKIRELLMEHTWMSRTLEEPYTKLDKERLKDMTLSPLDYQEEFFDKYDRATGQYGLNGFLFAGAAGSGKTFTGLALAHMLDPDHVVVICPKNALETVWRASIVDKFKKGHEQSYWIANSGVPYKGERFIVGHYEAIDQVRDVCAGLRDKMIVVILDESHNLNNDKSLRTDRFVALCEETDSRDVLWLSGTPIKALAVEAIPLLRCIDPLFNDDVQYRFRKMYSDNKGRALEILQARMGIITFIVTKDRLGLDKPIIQEIKVRMPNAQDYTLEAIKRQMLNFIKERTEYYKGRYPQDKAFYDKCVETYEGLIATKAQREGLAEYKRNVSAIIAAGGDFTVKEEMLAANRFEIGTIQPSLPKEIRGEWKNVRSIIKYVHLKIQGECLGRIVGGARIQCHVDMVPYIDFRAVTESTQKKTVVFTSFVNVLDRCEQVMGPLGLSPLFVSAKTNKNLSTIVSTFGKDEDANPLVATYSSLSTAVPLVMADTMILIDSPFRDYILQQAISRIHRLGADTQTYVYKVVLDTGDQPNISSRSSDILRWSQEQIEQILGVKSPFEIVDDLEEFGVALEGLDVEVLDSLTAAQPVYLSW